MYKDDRGLEEKGMSGIGRKIIWAVVSSLLVGLGGCLIYALTSDRKKPAPEEEVKKTVETIQKRVSFIKIEPSHLRFKDGLPIKTQFMLTIDSKQQSPQDAVYLFPLYEYIIETGNDETKIPTAKLCELVDQVYDRQEPILEIIRQIRVSGKISLPSWLGITVEAQADNLTTLLVEILYSIRKFYELRMTHPEIIIRGYADGKRSDWTRPLASGRFQFNRINVFPYWDSDTNTPILEPEYPDGLAYLKRETPIDIPSNYENRHLPDLRAMFVKKALVDPYLEDCKIPNKAESHIIKGYEFKKLDAPQERKVQIFILLVEQEND
jgi:hypothetical protein